MVAVNQALPSAGRSDEVRSWKTFAKQVLRFALPQSWMVWEGRTRRAREIAITFDDGPDPTFTPRVLDTLRDYDVRASFFVVGERAVEHRALLERMLAEGHEIGNHSFTHPDFDQLSWHTALDEIRRTKDIIEAVQGTPCRLFRPPKGKLCVSSVLGSWYCRSTLVMWSVDLKDFAADTPSQIADRLEASGLVPGDIVLYHGNSDASARALVSVLEIAQKADLGFVPVSAMLRGARPRRRPASPGDDPNVGRRCRECR
jgi:peptidoglycan/xylan/chitin deacetylase (PgdA/CDA1 family)